MYFWQYKFIIKRCFFKQRAVNRKKGIKMKKIEEYVRSIPDFPEPGIIFRDITSVLQDADGLQLAIDSMIKLLDGVEYDVVAGTESRGFIFGVPIAYEMHKPFVPVRKKGKLPCETISQSYDLEYGQATIEMHKDSIKPGQKVVIIDDLSNSNIEVLDGIERITGIRPEFIKLDLKDKEGTREALKAHPGIKGIILFAASKAVGESVQQPLKYYRNNVVTLVNLLELMPEFNIEGIVFSSSCTVYGQPDPENLPVTENAPIKPATSPYGNTKQINEEIIRDTIASGSPINAIMLRYFNPIGAHPTALIGELPNGVPQNLLPYVTQTAMGIREKLSVFGDDYDTPDGSCIRDYIYVVDLAKAHVIAMDRILNNKQKEKVEVFNIGTGNGVSVLELIRTFEKATGVKLNYQIVGRRAGDIEKVWANPDFANKELGWKAEANLEDTLRSAWNWQLKLRERGIQ